MNKILALSFLLTLSFFSCISSPKGHLLKPGEFKAKMEETKEMTLVDVRTPGEFSEGYLKNAINIDWNNSNFSDGVAKLDKNKPVFVYCRSGARSHSAANSLRDSGFTQVYELDGGIMGWQRDGMPVESPGEHVPSK